MQQTKGGKCKGAVQAVSFLVIHQKHTKSLEEITTDLCPVLSVQQLYRISTMYWDDRYNTETVSHDVLSRMKSLMVENNSAASHSFLLDDDSSIPFSLDDIQNLMDDKVTSTSSISTSFYPFCSICHRMCLPLASEPGCWAEAAMGLYCLNA